ncbi:hypothetical protein IAD21_04434 [Abditibacteriota bacterium]|nr:hypothetical protein IAD21_04434 [Abditibacteriota bacterium]
MNGLWIVVWGWFKNEFPSKRVHLSVSLFPNIIPGKHDSEVKRQGLYANEGTHVTQWIAVRPSGALELEFGRSLLTTDGHR